MIDYDARLALIAEQHDAGWTSTQILEHHGISKSRATELVRKVKRKRLFAEIEAQKTGLYKSRQ
ncbi:hypothetical protein G7068_11940 [Leucobacter viscericola]|uniref:Uncharacterized protein n=1 Tax=Leucobacter viscericola TaxID=2714935 RepID=A0A6G7XGU1_9MICO|nr:hypothetical protein [Leucobacter viscericola]QIK63820.1 hypothetical protein G7068_11940 [Leucobacter viscericola]